MRLESGEFESFLSGRKGLKLQDSFTEKLLEEIERGEAPDKSPEFSNKYLLAATIAILVNAVVLGISLSSNGDSNNSDGLEAVSETYFQSSSAYE